VHKVQPDKEKYMACDCEKDLEITRLEAAIINSRGPGGKLIGNEYCNSCGCDMGFPINTHIDDPIRFKDQAYYREGAGQSCDDCERKMPKK